jgi:phage tail sheath protein FI
VTVPVSYPGVYILEQVSSVHTITGVPTSVAAFYGYASQGPVGSATHVSSWLDYERTYGGIDPACPMSYAVYLFFANGGSDAEIVRATAVGQDSNKKPIVDAGSAATINITSADGKAKTPWATLHATSPGDWANDLIVKITSVTIPGGTSTTKFNLTIADSSGDKEQYPRITAAQLGGLLNSSSYLHLDPSTVPSGLPRIGQYTVPAAPADPAPAAPADPAPAAPADPAPAAKAAAAPAASDLYTDGTRGAAISTAGAPVLLDDPTGQGQAVGLHALDSVNIFNMLILPTECGLSGTTTPAWTYSNDVLGTVAEYCATKRAMLIVDAPDTWQTSGLIPLSDDNVENTPAVTGNYTSNAAVYYPSTWVTDPISGNVVEVGASSAVAGVWAATDASRGVWKAPAGLGAALTGVASLSPPALSTGAPPRAPLPIDDDENGVLNPVGVNCLRTFPVYGPVIWGARTCAGADIAASQWKYVPVRRTALFIEESLYRGTKWVVFEPNDETTWASVRLNVGAFMNSLFRQGAFQGTTPATAYLVKCDSENNPQNDIDRGILNILVGFAPLIPAEFVIISIQQLAGQLQT